MNRFTRRLVAAALAATFQLSAASAAELWTEDFAAAKETAAKEKKDLLMDFTGSDWCGWCIKLKEEVFSKPEFIEAAPKSFVLVELDYPQQKKQDEKIKAQNEKLSETYAVEGYPTIILADSTGRAYAKTGYEKGGPESYLKSLDELKSKRVKRDEAFAKAEKAEGLDKAKAIQEGLKAMDQEIVDAYYDKEVEQLISLDKDDTLGMKKAHEISKASAALQEKLEELHTAQNYTDFVKEIDTFITTWKLDGVEKQRMLMYKLAVYGPDKLDDAEKLVDEVIKIDEASEISSQAKQVKGQIAKIRAQGTEEKEEDSKPKAKDKKDDDSAEKEAK